MYRYRVDHYPGIRAPAPIVEYYELEVIPATWWSYVVIPYWGHVAEWTRPFWAAARPISMLQPPSSRRDYGDMRTLNEYD